MIFPILLAAAAPAAATATDYLAGIHAGKILCSNPNSIAKTCSNIDRYAQATDGSWTNTGEVMLSPAPLVTLETTAAIHIDGATYCGMLDLADLQNGKVRVNGDLLPADRNALAIGKVVEAMAAYVGHKVCEHLYLEGAVLMKSGTMEGVDAKMPIMPVAWIAPSDGYKVGTPSAPGQ